MIGRSLTIKETKAKKDQQDQVLVLWSHKQQSLIGFIKNYVVHPRQEQHPLQSSTGVFWSPRAPSMHMAHTHTFRQTLTYFKNLQKNFQELTNINSKINESNMSEFLTDQFK